MMNLYRVIRDTELDVRRITKDLNARVAVSAKFVEEVSRQRTATDSYSQANCFGFSHELAVNRPIYPKRSDNRCSR